MKIYQYWDEMSCGDVSPRNVSESSVVSMSQNWLTSLPTATGSPMEVAAWNGDVGSLRDQLREIKEYHVTSRVVTAAMTNALYLAAGNGHVHCCSLLLQAGADPAGPLCVNPPNIAMGVPLHKRPIFQAVRCRHPAVVLVLGGTVGVNEEVNTPLEKLITPQSDVASIDHVVYDGRSAMSKAAMQRDVEMIDALTAIGAVAHSGSLLDMFGTGLDFFTCT